MKEPNARIVLVEDGMEIDSSTGVAKGSHTSPNGEPRPRQLTIAGFNIAPGQGNNSNPMAGGSSLADANQGQIVILPPRARINRDRESLEDGRYPDGGGQWVIEGQLTSPGLSTLT